MTLGKKLAAPLLLAIMLTTVTAQPSDVRRVKFKPGRSSAVVKSVVARHGTITYLVNAKSGQTMSLSISRGAAFRLSTPSGNTLEGGKAVSRTTQELDETGDYRVVVESLSDRRSQMPFTLEIFVTY